MENKKGNWQVSFPEYIFKKKEIWDNVKFEQNMEKIKI